MEHGCGSAGLPVFRQSCRGCGHMLHRPRGQPSAAAIGDPRLANQCLTCFQSDWQEGFIRSAADRPSVMASTLHRAPGSRLSASSLSCHLYPCLSACIRVATLVLGKRQRERESQACRDEESDKRAHSLPWAPTSPCECRIVCVAARTNCCSFNRNWCVDTIPAIHPTIRDVGKPDKIPCQSAGASAAW